jgi:hypothetical protein
VPTGLAGGLSNAEIMDRALEPAQRFGTAHNYNYPTLAGNVAIGAEYLEWLIAYFGTYYCRCGWIFY